MLTTKGSAEDIQRITETARGMVLDYLAAGINPETCIIYLQSAIPEVYGLTTLFQNLIYESMNRLSRLPSLKEMAQAAHLDERSMPYGLLGYPILQAADILLARVHLVQGRQR
jgi:tryptophanyl-tRNA synthetase